MYTIFKKKAKHLDNHGLGVSRWWVRYVIAMPSGLELTLTFVGITTLLIIFGSDRPLGNKLDKYRRWYIGGLSLGTGIVFLGLAASLYASHLVGDIILTVEVFAVLVATIEWQNSRAIWWRLKDDRRSGLDLSGFPQHRGERRDT